MRYKAVFLILFSLFWGAANANWIKVSDVDYTWGPFDIYHITLFTETGQYTENIRPLMLTLQYKKPWEGRDFAVSLARAWKNLNINLPPKETDTIINHLRRTFPDIKPEDRLHYIALEDRGYFILNDKVVSETFNKEFSDAITAIWLHPKMDIGRQLLDPSYKSEQTIEEPQIAMEQGEILNAQEEITQAEQNISPQFVDKAEELLPHINKADNSQNKSENKNEDMPEIENPEVFISPIYDDILMFLKNYI